MPRRHPDGSVPGLRHAPLPEHHKETVFEWLARQKSPVKPKQPRNFTPRQTSVEAAIAVAIEKRRTASDATPAVPSLEEE